MDKLNESAEERLTSLESSQIQIQSDLKAFQKETGDNIKQILALLSNNSQSAKPDPPATPKTSDEEVHHKAVGWKVTVDLLQKELEAKKVALADIDHLRDTLKQTTLEKSELEDQLQEVEKEREQHKHEKELLQQRLMELGVKEEDANGPSEFPSNETILHNLLVAQIEFYFSNHHLKRDKPLMEKLCDPPDVGFVNLEEVTSFPKVRTLGQGDDVIRKAVDASRHLCVKENDGVVLIGREQFQPPRAQEFPFRRTVFVYGIPPSKAQNESWIREQFECFGNIAKVKFDSGPHSLPRKVGARLLSKEKTRVVRLHMRDQDHTEFKFQKFNAHNAQVTTYYCHECGKVKNYKDGYYVSDKRSPQSCVFCVQCAAKRAESNLKYFQTRCHNHYMDSDSLKQLFGIDLNEYSNTNLQSFRTCLVVFESQRQASKCVYVRSRLGIEGCFATHFHNYTRHKREISQGIELPEPSMSKQDSQFRLEPRRNMAPQRSVGARVEKSFARMPGLSMPKMRKHQSTPALGGHGKWRKGRGSNV